MTKRKPTTDRVSLGPHIGPHARLAVRERDGEQELTLVGPLRDGVPLPDHAEIVHLEAPDCTCDGWQAATTLYRPSERRTTESGPVQVATPAYRDGYDRIFGKQPTVGLA